MSIDEQLAEIERKLAQDEVAAPLLLQKASLLERAGRQADAVYAYAEILKDNPEHIGAGRKIARFARRAIRARRRLAPEAPDSKKHVEQELSHSFDSDLHIFFKTYAHAYRTWTQAALPFSFSVLANIGIWMLIIYFRLYIPVVFFKFIVGILALSVGFSLIYMTLPLVDTATLINSKLRWARTIIASRPLTKSALGVSLPYDGIKIRVTRIGEPANPRDDNKTYVSISINDVHMHTLVEEAPYAAAQSVAHRWCDTLDVPMELNWFDRPDAAVS